MMRDGLGEDGGIFRSRRRFTAGLASLAGLGVSGCASNSMIGMVSASIHSKVPSTDEYPLSAGQIQELPYATMGVWLEKRPRVVMLLATIEGDELTWASSDRVALVTRKGRLVRTGGLNRNLLQTRWPQPDPLETAATDDDPADGAIYRSVDLKPDPESEVVFESRFELRGTETIVIQDREVDTRYFEEHVIVRKWRWETQNRFWIGANDGRVWRSVQRFCPEVPPITMEILKPVAA